MRIRLDIDESRVAQALETANVRYWCAKATMVRNPHGAHFWHAPLVHGGCIELTVRDDGGKPVEARAIRLGTVKAGLADLARLQPAAFGRVIAGTADSSDGDLLLQCIAFGAILFA